MKFFCPECHGRLYAGEAVYESDGYQYCLDCWSMKMEVVHYDYDFYGTPRYIKLIARLDAAIARIEDTDNAVVIIKKFHRFCHFQCEVFS